MLCKCVSAPRFVVHERLCANEDNVFCAVVVLAIDVGIGNDVRVDVEVAKQEKLALYLQDDLAPQVEGKFTAAPLRTLTKWLFCS